MPNPEESLSQLGLVFPEAAAEAPAALRRVWRVGQLVGEVRNHIEREYADVWVEGESRTIARLLPVICTSR